MLRTLIVEIYGQPVSRSQKLFVSDHRPSEIWRLPRGIPLLYHSHFIKTAVGAEPHLGDMLETMAPFRNIPMLVLYRDVKDVMVSYYMEVVFREPTRCFEGSVDEFVHSDTYGVKKFVAYYNAMAEFRRAGRGPTLVMRYEDLWADTVGGLHRAADFLGLRDLTEERLQRVVAQWSLDNMRKLENSATPETALVPGLHRPVREQPEAQRARVGGSGNWRKHLSSDAAAWADDYVTRNLDPYFRDLAPAPDASVSDGQLPR
jgi:hypothetical protein